MNYIRLIPILILGWALIKQCSCSLAGGAQGGFGYVLLQTNSIMLLNDSKDIVLAAIEYDTHGSGVTLSMESGSITYGFDTNTLYVNLGQTIDGDGAADGVYTNHNSAWTRTTSPYFAIVALGTGWELHDYGASATEFVKTNAVHPWDGNWRTNGGGIVSGGRTIARGTNGFVFNDSFSAPGSVMVGGIIEFAGGWSTNFDSTGLGTNITAKFKTLGWAIANGNNGTTPLVGQFTQAADSDSGGSYPLGSTAGAANHEHAVAGIDVEATLMDLTGNVDNLGPGNGRFVDLSGGWGESITLVSGTVSGTASGNTELASSLPPTTRVYKIQRIK